MHEIVYFEQNMQSTHYFVKYVKGGEVQDHLIRKNIDSDL